MNLYYHYKNKPYRYIGIAKHSESLTDLVVYECRYENPSGKLWVRPKEMFFENVLIDGKSIPRFRKADINLTLSDTFSLKEFQRLQGLIESVFSGSPKPQWSHFEDRLKDKENVKLWVLQEGSYPVAFKLGYDLSPKVFYSWQGGVAPFHRGVGLAQDLMSEMIRCCQTQAYTKIVTKSMNKFSPMISLNLKNGFQITGVEPSGEDLKILMELQLARV